MITEYKYELGKLVTFVPNKRLPIYNWFYFKEGFSRDFVTLMFKQFKLEKGKCILDTFCGVGTSLLAAKEQGINAFGVDADPLFAFVSQVKTRNYELAKLKRVTRDLFSKEFKKPEIINAPPLIKKAFSKYALEDVIFFKNHIGEIDDTITRNFFTLALIVSAMQVSYAIKNGALIKFFKKPFPPLRKVFKNKIKRWIRQLEKAKFEVCETNVQVGDARGLKFLEDESFDAIITSPPYLNQTEYIKAYAIEYALFFPRIKVDPITTYLGLNLQRKMEIFRDMDLPEVAKAYFFDIKLCLQEIFRVLNEGGKVALVVGDGVFPNQAKIIESGKLSARLAKEVGFEVEKIWIVNKRVVTRERTIKIGEAKESVIIMEKSIH